MAPVSNSTHSRRRRYERNWSAEQEADTLAHPTFRTDSRELGNFGGRIFVYQKKFGARTLVLIVEILGDPKSADPDGKIITGYWKP